MFEFWGASLVRTNTPQPNLMTPLGPWASKHQKSRCFHHQVSETSIPEVMFHSQNYPPSEDHAFIETMSQPFFKFLRKVIFCYLLGCGLTTLINTNFALAEPPVNDSGLGLGGNRHATICGYLDSYLECSIILSPLPLRRKSTEKLVIASLQFVHRTLRLTLISLCSSIVVTKSSL